jgi:crotonobetainyl-CoA:carnitine CoA-transferase CaiB-like acyl-CoA transferase
MGQTPWKGHCGHKAQDIGLQYVLMRAGDAEREGGDPPLQGIRVLTLAVNLPGPVAASRLCAMGASVIKVEPPGGDPLALMCPGYYEELRSGQEVVRSI